MVRISKLTHALTSYYIVPDDIIALNKPSGLAVHAGPKLHNHLSHYKHLWQYEQSELPELAHRLDKLNRQM